MVTVLVLLAGVVAVVDWWAVATHRRRAETICKPLTMALLVGVAVTAGDMAGDARTWLVVGAILGLVGDVALLDDGETAFMVGLGAFALGHIAYAVASVLVGFDPAWATIGIVFVVALLGFRFATRTLPGAIAHGGPALGGAVAFYAAVISAMVITAWGTGIVVAGVGASLFAISDWVLGHRRFVGPLPGGRLAVMVPYHVGQALLVLGVTRAI